MANNMWRRNASISTLTIGKRIKWDSPDSLSEPVIQLGTSTYKLTTATAGVNFVELRVESTATSGDARGIYNRLYLAGAGGSGEALRAFTTVDDVAAANVHGAHISLSFADTGSVTGLGVAGRNTLHIPSAAMSGGTYAPLMSEIWSDGVSSDVTGVTKLTHISISNGGNATGLATVDDKASLFSINGGADASGNMTYGNTVRCEVLGNTRYLILSTTENTLTYAGTMSISSTTTQNPLALFNVTSNSTGACRALKSIANGPASGNCGDLIGGYGLAEMPSGSTATTAASTTLASHLGWTTVDASNTIGSGNILCTYRGIFQGGSDLSAIAGGGQSAIFYGNLWATGSPTINAGIWIANSSVQDPSMKCVLGASSAGSTCKVGYGFDFSDVVFSSSLATLPDDNVCADNDATQAIGNLTTAGWIKVHVGGLVRYIWLSSNAPT